MTSNALFGLVEPGSIRQQLTSAEQIAEEHIFDYSDLDSEVRIVVQKRTDENESDEAEIEFRCGNRTRQVHLSFRPTGQRRHSVLQGDDSSVTSINVSLRIVL